MTLKSEIEQRQVAGLLRRRRCLQSPQGATVQIDGQTLLSFCSNDYLGLAGDPRVARAMADSVKRTGAGAGASHLVSGHHEEHQQLEQALAAFVGAEKALLFSTGYMANLAVATALLDRHDHIFEDRLNHASLIDAARLSRARSHRFAHGDTQALARLLETHSGPRRLVMSDGVFSMDGDQVKLAELVPLLSTRDTWLLLDDAHGLGVVGKEGRGSYARAGLQPGGQYILMGTLGKALGTFGAFVAGDLDLIELLIQKARTYIYTTALPPPVAAATRAALDIVMADSWRREQLDGLVARFRHGMEEMGLSLMPSMTPIQPLIVGEASRAVALSEALQRKGFLVPAIRPPTVAAGSARLRFTFSALHQLEDVDRLLQALSDIADDLKGAPLG